MPIGRRIRSPRVCSFATAIFFQLSSHNLVGVCSLQTEVERQRRPSISCSCSYSFRRRCRSTPPTAVFILPKKYSPPTFTKRRRWAVTRATSSFLRRAGSGSTMHRSTRVGGCDDSGRVDGYVAIPLLEALLERSARSSNGSFRDGRRGVSEDVLKSKGDNGKTSLVRSAKHTTYQPTCSPRRVACLGKRVSNCAEANVFIYYTPAFLFL